MQPNIFYFTKDEIDLIKWQLSQIQTCVMGIDNEHQEALILRTTIQIWRELNAKHHRKN